MSDAVAHAHAVPDPRTPHQVYLTAKFGMWMFLASEIMFFTGFIGSYIVLRIANPEVMARGHRYPEGVVQELRAEHQAAHHPGVTCDHTFNELNPWIGVTNTFILIVSSLTMALGINNLGKKNVKWVRIFLAITASLGGAFLVIKIFTEWMPKFEHHIDWTTSIFFGSYFLTTGFHGLHVLVGMIMMFILLACDDDYFRRHYAMVENTGLYWHFVDIVWIFLFPMFYLMP
jgi:cytochrome c oxidase subunit 3